MPYTDSRIKSGELRHVAELVKPYGPSQSTFGDLSLANYSPVRTFRCSINSIQGKDVLAANQFSDEITHVIACRYRNDIFTADQVWFQGAGTYVRQFQILYVLNPDERNKKLYLLCVEINQSKQQVVSGASTDLE